MNEDLFAPVVAYKRFWNVFTQKRKVCLFRNSLDHFRLKTSCHCQLLLIN